MTRVHPRSGFRGSLAFSNSSNRKGAATLAEFLVGASRRRRLSALLRAKAYYGLK